MTYAQPVPLPDAYHGRSVQPDRSLRYLVDGARLQGRPGLWACLRVPGGYLCWPRPS